MKKQAGNKIRLGIFVSTGLIILIIAIYFVGKKQQLFNQTINISGIFKDISGLQVGNNVRFAGITIGVIENIEMIADTAVKVDFSIDEKSQKFIRVDAKAIIGSDGLMGNKIVIITPGTKDKKHIENDDFISTSIPINFDDILNKLKVTGDNSANITNDLAFIINNIRAGKGTVGKLFMDTVLAENIDQTILNIKQGAGGFKQNMTAASHNILLRGFFKKKKAKK